MNDQILVILFSGLIRLISNEDTIMPNDWQDYDGIATITIFVLVPTFYTILSVKTYLNYRNLKHKDSQETKVYGQIVEGIDIKQIHPLIAIFTALRDIFRTCFMIFPIV